ncbi:hypothetical protein [Dictyobacter kobayashii]|uniref:Uncharacterized protein n=1 Tax=Dictyobacter kobayashii TaxID=2014872 RepID=A0A402AEM8_9CHLR|nr:hypothetical protein [Dictyobacter kobayashii]GCE17570.1 hypothetical protein KDK_13700 [Dictyobacter kobayashii]
MGEQERIQPTRAIKGVEYYNVGTAAQYVGLSITGFRNKVDNYNKTHQDDKIQKWSFPGSRERLIKRSDLDKLIELHPVDEW